MAACDPFKGKVCIRCDDFEGIFKKYDKDGNGQIEAAELDDFLADLVKEFPGDVSVDSLKSFVLKKYDINCDEKITMKELAVLLPTEQNFLANFRQENKFTSVDFMKIWNECDIDKSGYIEAKELDKFLQDLTSVKSSNITLDKEKIDNYKERILFLYDRNNDGKLDLSELAKLLLEDNFMDNFKICRSSLTREQFNDIFSYYDQDASGTIEGTELLALLRDIDERTQTCTSVKKLEDNMEDVLRVFDTNKDGKLSKEELAMLLSRKL